MSVSASDFINFSESINNTPNNEIRHRNVVSRSYYSMYHNVLGILTNKPIQYASSGSHASLATYLVSHDAKKNEPYSDMKLRQLNILLKMYKEKRCIADYQLIETVTKNQADESLNAAKRVQDICKDLVASVP